MKVEIPKFKRCCFCIPLRHGLLVWGYIKLVITLIIFLFGSLLVQTYMQFYFVYGMAVLPAVLMGVVFLLFLMLDTAMTVMFLIGGHRKTVKLMKVFYIYSIVLLCVMTAIFIMSTIYDLSVGDKYQNRYRSSYRRQHEVMSYGAMVTAKVVTAVTFLGIQAYIILLIRSEINKLQNSRNFWFKNNAAEAECTMDNKNEPKFIAPNTDCEVGTENMMEVEETIKNEGTYSYNKF